MSVSPPIPCPIPREAFVYYNLPFYTQLIDELIHTYREVYHSLHTVDLQQLNLVRACARKLETDGGLCVFFVRKRERGREKEAREKCLLRTASPRGPLSSGLPVL